MRIVKWVLGILVLLVLAMLVIGLLLPRQVNVSRSIEISAPPEVVFPHVNNLKLSENWSPWTRLDPDIKITYEGPEAGVGAQMSWTSQDPQVGDGSMTITDSIENTRVASSLDFGEMGKATATHDLAETDSGTTVTWGLNVDMGSGPVGRWMGLMMDRWVGADYDRGLANLKAVVETP